MSDDYINDSNLFSPTGLVEDLLQTDLDVNVFDGNVDTNVSFPKAPNFYVFVTDHDNFCSIHLFPRQIQWGINLFEDYCPYCSDVEFASGGMFDQTLEEIENRITFFEFGECPKCGKNRNDAVKDGFFHNNDELAVCAGMRAGKTVFTATAALYHLHRYLTLSPSPSEYFGTDKVMTGQELQITFCAIQLQQAYDTLWRQFITIYEESKWFNRYEKFLKDMEIKNPDQKFYRKSDSPTDPSLRFFNKRIEITCETPNIKAIRGRTRIFTAIDEIGWMDTERDKAGHAGKKMMSAQETYEALRKSLQTVRSASDHKKGLGFFNSPTAISCNISSPSHINDMIMSLVKENLISRVSYHLATWEVNPFIPKENCLKEANNQEAFLRDYQATPPFSSSPYFPSVDAIQKAVSDYKQTSMFNWSIKDYVDPHGFKMIYLDVNAFKHDKNIPRLLTLDQGHVYDSFSLCLSHLERGTGKIQADLILELSPQFPGKLGKRINFPLMYENAITPILENFNVQNVIYDRWQSIDQIQRIRMDFKDTMAEAYSLKWSDFVSCKNDLYDGKFRFPLPEMTVDKFRSSHKPHWELVADSPIIHSMIQILTVREVGKKVIKPAVGSDDIWRSIALTLWFFSQKKNQERYKKYALTDPHNIGRNANIGAVVLSSNSRNVSFTNSGVRISRRPPR